MTEDERARVRGDETALERVRAHLAAGIAVRQECLLLEAEKIAAAACLVIESVTCGGRVFLLGNGGSAADAQHLAAEYVGRFSRPRAPIPAVALTTDTSVLTSIANDFGYAQVFARQVEALVRPGDVVMAISTSGESASAVEGAQAARRRGAAVIAMTGRDGGGLAALADVALRAPSDETALIQEAHIAIGHAICAAVEEAWLSGRAGDPGEAAGYP